ncbi:mersacidin/lichenicidin family type 2 lantibiotic [Amycolatopsis japonica]|uniref:mersacidin/lichenicidin family type 2 lantibiotic n=1 Tax=Amycolatopsis japonica TaxID=208439 RepID=UPI0033C4FB7E
MSEYDIVRYWKDEGYRAAVGGNILPANPAGIVELTDEALDSLVAGAGAEMVLGSCLFVSCFNQPQPDADQA